MDLGIPLERLLKVNYETIRLPIGQRPHPRTISGPQPNPGRNPNLKVNGASLRSATIPLATLTSTYSALPAGAPERWWWSLFWQEGDLGDGVGSVEDSSGDVVVDARLVAEHADGEGEVKIEGEELLGRLGAERLKAQEMAEAGAKDKTRDEGMNAGRIAGEINPSPHPPLSLYCLGDGPSFRRRRIGVAPSFRRRHRKLPFRFSIITAFAPHAST